MGAGRPAYRLRASKREPSRYLGHAGRRHRAASAHANGQQLHAQLELEVKFPFARKVRRGACVSQLADSLDYHDYVGKVSRRLVLKGGGGLVRRLRTLFPRQDGAPDLATTLE